tara:strand:- start:1290 stop:1439 length:150 start_codon:yes stop_codon:yes gene_type:complete
MIEFWIDRRGNMVVDGATVGCFGGVDAAADAAVRIAQDRGRPYRIFYPL